MNKKAFTLIELLAVISILAIIALIATPSILNIVNDSKIKSLKRSSELYIRGVEQAIYKRDLEDDSMPIKNGKYDVMSNGNICLEYNTENKCINMIELEITGNIPTDGFVDIIDNEITYYDLKIDGKYVSKKEYTPEECFETSGGTITKFKCAPMIYDSNQSKAIENTNSINNITDVVIPSEINGKKVQEIANNAFAGNLITSVIIPNSVTEMGLSVFNSNELTNIILPDKITTINSYTFYNNKLTNVILPSKLKMIKDCGFCSNQLTSIELPVGINKIDGAAFKDNKLTSIKIPNTITSIGINSFRYNQLTSITIPSSVNEISSYAFANNKLTSVIVEGKNSISNFESYPTSTPFGWASGYSDKDIIWEP